ncbi:hypothetical protein BH18VER1_BH18VER1_02410 [soil metagenome]
MSITTVSISEKFWLNLKKMLDPLCWFPITCSTMMSLSHSFRANPSKCPTSTVASSSAGPTIRSTATPSAVRLRSPIFVFCVLSALVVTCAQAFATNTYDYTGVCPYPNGGKRIDDRWGMWQCECTSYSADKLNERGVPFRWNYKSTNWGSAGHWLSAAKATGTSYSKYPRRGDVAWWSFGHVATVDAVDSYGNVTISEYNWNWNRNYNRRTLKRGTSSYPHYFIHF